MPEARRGLKQTENSSETNSVPGLRGTGVRAGAHARNLASHGVLPLGDGWETQQQQQQEQNVKIKRFEREAEQDYYNFVRKREQERVDELKERERVRSMLHSYNPWGKPGAGAPQNTTDHRKNKFTEEDLRLDQVHRADEETPFYKSGGGAAVQTKSGKVRAGFRQSSDIRFMEEAAKDIQDKFRYKPENLSSSLKENSKEATEAEKSSNFYETDNEKEMLKTYPYAVSGDGKNFRKNQTLARGKKAPLLADDDEPFDPWGKGFGAPNRDNHGNVRRYKFSDPNKGGVLAMSEGGPGRPSANEDNWKGATIPLSDRGGAGAPRNTRSGKPATRCAQTLVRTTQGDNEIKLDRKGEPVAQTRFDEEGEEIYNPWGRPGAGAPRRDPQGQLVHRKARVPTGDMRARLEHKKSFLKEQEKLIDEQKNLRQKEDQEHKSGYGDLASKINSGLIGRPKRDEYGQLAPQHLGVSDVTAHSTSYVRPAANLVRSKSYLTDLEQQARERSKMREAEFKRENTDYQTHMQAFNDMWGRPGHGAPLSTQYGDRGEYKKKNLIGSLYSNNFMKTMQTNITPTK